MRMATNTRIMIAAVLCLWCGVQSAAGRYAPEVNVTAEQEKKVKAGQRAVKSLSEKERQLFLAYKLGLLYDTKWPSGYESSPDARFAPESGFRSARCGARVVLPDGKEVFYREATRKIAVKRWETAARMMAEVGNHAVCVAFAEEVEALVKAAVQRHYSTLPVDARDSIRALLTDTLYYAEGKSAKHRIETYKRDGMNDEEYEQPWVCSARDNEKLRSRDGRELRLRDILHALDGEMKVSIDHIYWCVHLIGKDDVLAVMDKVDGAGEKKEKKAKRKSRAGEQ